MKYDIQGDLSEFTNPDGTSIRYEHDKLDALVSKNTDDELANQAMFGYDEDGRQISMDDVAGTSDYEYDGIGRITAVYLPMDVTAPVNPDEATSAAVSVEVKDKTEQTSNVRLDKFTERAKIAYEYDEWGNLARLVYPDHTTVVYEYDELDRMTKITDRHGNETTYTYDISGNLTRVRRPNNTLTVMEYDVMGKIVKLENRGEDISLSSFEYEYDLTGNIVSEISVQDDVTHTRTFTYDNRNQLVKSTDNNGYYTQYYTYEYDKNGNRTRAIESKGTNVTKDTKYVYDAADKLVKSADTVHWETRTTTYDYDKNGNLIQMNMPFGAKLTYNYNVENRLTAVHDKEHLLMAALYDGNGDRIFTVTNKEDSSGWHDDGNNGGWHTLKPGGDYDDGTWHPDTSSADDGQWKPDVSSGDDGQWKPDVSSGDDGQWKPDVSSGDDGQWHGDTERSEKTSNVRLDDGSWKPNSTTNSLTTENSDDKVIVGNNGQWQPDTSNSSYDDGQWKPDVSSDTSSYDDGSWKPDVSSETSSETTSSDVSSDTSSETTSSDVSSDTTSDGNTGIPDVELAKGPWTNFDYDREMIRDTVLIPNGLNEWNEERYELTGYINNINMANTQALMEFHDKGYAGNIYEYGVKRESVTHWGNTNYYGYDGRGSVSDIMDGNGEVQMYHSYEPDGQTTMRFRSYVKNPYRYNAERVDYIPGIADFQYLRARYYTPDTARFIQQDTVWGKIDVPLSQNLYAYCGNNPLNFVDPSGHYPKEAEEYYRNKLDEATNSYVALEKAYDKIYSQMDKIWIQEQMKQNKKDIALYEQTLSMMTGSSVKDSIARAKGETVRMSCEVGIYSYYDDKGNVYIEEWKITNKMFLDKDTLTKQQIEDILNKYNPDLVNRGFHEAIYNACRDANINPKVLLATLCWETTWGTSSEKAYQKAFGVGVAGSPKGYTDPNDFGGLYDAIGTYMKWFKEGIEMEINGDFEDGMIVNQDKYFQDIGGGGSSKDYVDKNPGMADYMIAGQEIVPVNAAMYARLKFNSWLYYPADEGNKGSHSTKKWHDTVIYGLDGE